MYLISKDGVTYSYIQTIGTYFHFLIVVELAQTEKYASVLKIRNDKEHEMKSQEKTYHGYVNPYYVDSLTSYVFAVSFWQQFWTLLKRKLLQTRRAHLTLFCEIGHHLICGLIVGGIFYDRGNNAVHLVDNIKLYYGMVIYFMFAHGMILALLSKYFNLFYKGKIFIR